MRLMFGGDVTGPVAEKAAVAEEEWLMEGGSGVGVAEPGGDVADGGTISVVEAMAGGEDLDDLGLAVGGEAAEDCVEQAGVQALLQEDVG